MSVIPSYSVADNLPAPITSGSGTQSFTDVWGDVWVAANNVNGGNWRRARDVLHAKYWRNAALTLTAGAWSGTVNMDTAVFDDYGMYSGGLFTAPVVGMWLFIFQAGMTPTATAQWIQPGIWETSPSNVIADPLAHASGTYQVKVCASVVKRVTSLPDTFYVRVAASTACALAVGAVDGTYFEMHYLGTG